MLKWPFDSCRRPNKDTEWWCRNSPKSQTGWSAQAIPSGRIQASEKSLKKQFAWSGQIGVVYRVEHPHSAYRVCVTTAPQGKFLARVRSRTLWESLRTLWVTIENGIKSCPHVTFQEWLLQCAGGRWWVTQPFSMMSQKAASFLSRRSFNTRVQGR